MASLNLGSVSFADDPYQAKTLRPLLERAGLWNPAWDAWASDQSDAGEGGGAPVAAPDLSSLAGYGAAYGDYGGGNRYQAIVKDGKEVAGNPYFYDEPALFQGQDLLKAGALVGGSALGLNALFGGLGAGAEGLMLAGEYGGAGALGDASLLTGSSLGTVAQPAAGLTYGGSALGGGLSAANAGLTGGGSPAYLSDAALAPMEVPSAEWQNPTTPTPATPAVLDASGALPAAGGASLMDKLPGLLTNPRLIGAVAGGLLGGSGGGSSGGAAPYTGPMPTIERGNWSPTAQATQMQVPQFGQGLLSGPGTPNAGLWRFRG